MENYNMNIQNWIRSKMQLQYAMIYLLIFTKLGSLHFKKQEIVILLQYKFGSHQEA